MEKKDKREYCLAAFEILSNDVQLSQFVVLLQIMVPPGQAYVWIVLSDSWTC